MTVSSVDGQATRVAVSGVDGQATRVAVSDVDGKENLGGGERCGWKSKFGGGARLWAMVVVWIGGGLYGGGCVDEGEKFGVCGGFDM